MAEVPPTEPAGITPDGSPSDVNRQDTTVHLGAEFAAQLAAMEAGGAVLHCFAGRDRTGLLTALLLQLPELPGGPADRDEQHAVYTAGVRGINDYRRTAEVPHPYERWVPPEDWDAHLAERLAALDEVLDAWPADRVRALLPR